MSEIPNVPPLPDYERRQQLEKFLAALDEDASLAPARAILKTRNDRYFALVAALERSILRGSPSAARPHHDDEPTNSSATSSTPLATIPISKTTVPTTAPGNTSPASKLSASGVATSHSFAPPPTNYSPPVFPP